MQYRTVKNPPFEGRISIEAVADALIEMGVHGVPPGNYGTSNGIKASHKLGGVKRSTKKAAKKKLRRR